MKLTIEHLINDTYQVIDHDPEAPYQVLFQGEYADCVAYILVKS